VNDDILMDIPESESDEGDLNGVLCELIEEDKENNHQVQLPNTQLIQNKSNSFGYAQPMQSMAPMHQVGNSAFTQDDDEGFEIQSLRKKQDNRTEW
jgi:hypothetical protein